MKHIFIINPAAGGKDGTEAVRKALAELSEPIDAELYVTKGIGDAKEAVRRFRQEQQGHLRFYACGGDGTLCETVSGLVGLEDVSLSCLAIGSCNDFVKYYGKETDFLDLDALVHGKETRVDLIRMGDRYSINVIDVGFDSVVARMAVNLRHTPIIGGARGYIFGIAKALITSMKSHITVTADGETLNADGTLLLCTVANGSHVGGGYCCAPHSDNGDGLLEVCFVRPLSRTRFLRLVSTYRAGRHLDDPRFEKYIIYRRAKHVHFSSEKAFDITVDGELIPGKSFDVEVLPHALTFVVPEGVYQKKRELSAASAG